MCVFIQRERETDSHLAHSDSDIVGHSPVHSVNTEAAQQQQLLKGRQVLLIFHGERSLFWCIQVIPLRWGGKGF